MSHLTVEAKAAVKDNLQLELKARAEKLVAMSEAQVASLRSRLERRVNRIPNSKRTMTLLELLEPSASGLTKVARTSPLKKEAAPNAVLAPVPTRTATQPAARKTRAAPAKAAPAAQVAPKPAQKATVRGKKRPSDDGDKENEELSVPKKRVKAMAKPAAPAPAPAARSTRAASKKVAPSANHVLSPKPTNSRPATRTRRVR
ncbi:hypothetical protein DPSP01_008483 [Paraphaeosphaeria sporulosa]|uniref:Borealin N-terminal domain-containing protein n=1 Tax=Paraphaeosphaeria sporulosa TaxID=1460663 RepID=A0A177BW43_9PLEO|nr:uncharacterized protein CC84DRAFT_1181699 [Paraphaeosphaeria sporulosa]OAF98961.1 hypothetical protein CC84DRAFT_1181699 [Paraphaeosphaeria sporulosa]